MFDQDSNASQSKTSQVVGMVTSGTTWGRRTLTRDQNPKKMFEEVTMLYYSTKPNKTCSILTKDPFHRDTDSKLVTRGIVGQNS